ncbi:MAG: hypothetical protein AAF754_03105 [Pseudomonadota bacterium]
MKSQTMKAAALALGLVALPAASAFAATVSTVTQAVNIFTSGVVTGGTVLTVDASSTSLTMTFVNDPAALGISVYDASTVDQYFFEFDTKIAAASISTATVGFATTVSPTAPGTTANSVGSFLPGLATSFDFGNGGILIGVGEGTNLNTVGTRDHSPSIFLQFRCPQVCRCWQQICLAWVFGHVARNAKANA